MVQIDSAGHHRVEAAKGDVVQFNPRLATNHKGCFGIVRNTDKQGKVWVHLPHVEERDSVIPVDPDELNYIGRALHQPRSFLNFHADQHQDQTD